jgi:hypothetical protein
VCGKTAQSLLVNNVIVKFHGGEKGSCGGGVPCLFTVFSTCALGKRIYSASSAAKCELVAGKYQPHKSKKYSVV